MDNSANAQPQATPAPQPIQSAEHHSSSNKALYIVLGVIAVVLLAGVLVVSTMKSPTNQAPAATTTTTRITTPIPTSSAQATTSGSTDTSDLQLDKDAGLIQKNLNQLGQDQQTVQDTSGASQDQPTQ